MDHIKRHNLGSILHIDSKKSASPTLSANRPAKLNIVVESPPLVSFNPPEQSSGALFSAQVQVTVTHPNVEITSFELQLVQVTTIKKPVHVHCPDCSTKTTELKKWTFASESEPLRLARGEHPFPFSYLFPGNLPASTQAGLATLGYVLLATAKTTTGEILTYSRPVQLSRAVIPGPEKHSVRVFPPTNLTASVTMAPVVHLFGDIPISMRLSGISTRSTHHTLYWRLRKLSWRIEEHQKMTSPACPKHAPKLGAKSLVHDDVRTVGEREVKFDKNPWKSDFAAGEIDAEFVAALNPAKKPVCDVDAPNGLSVSHNLVIEMVVAEECSSVRRPGPPVATGGARILRMQFRVIVTERAGLGVSWDEETPPTYQDVPESPPSYNTGHAIEYDIAELDGHVEDFHLGEPIAGAALPRYVREASDSGSARSASSASAERPVIRLEVEDLMLGPEGPGRDEAVEG
ncbi:hypothetical protein EJ06DRAFT_479737 [Trichodelitschia bisporula]|uniref:LDB19 N-terminal domain-containing protein n=1 Tax=Trichodelitschia bisporula TaxID=703511 RepID=A0A6G1HS05_9PEZI|nr:hypothetical protein EJ06DRAFT_479737 [Trichodelitschia bisporula]